MSLVVEGVVELVQEVAGDCCFVVEDVVGLAQDVAGDCCFIVEGAGAGGAWYLLSPQREPC